MMEGRGKRAAVLASFATQIGWCDGLGSPLTTAVLRALAEDVAAGGIAAGLNDAWSASRPPMLCHCGWRPHSRLQC